MNEKFNHIAILIDRSGSTRRIASDIRQQFNLQAAEINLQATATGQKTHLSLYTFSDVADHALLFEVPLGLVNLNPIKEEAYEIGGMTALSDSVGRAIEDLSQFHRDTKGDHSFLVIVLTDGEENASTKYGWVTLANVIREKESSDVWTFAFLVPRGAKEKFVQRLGIREGNVREWDTSKAGVEIAGALTRSSIGSYYTARASGLRSSGKGGFFTDLSGITRTTLKRELDDLTSKFKKGFVGEVDCTTSDRNGTRCALINEFCEKKFSSFAPGLAYYELIKKEKIQDHKDLVIEDATGKLFGGAEARRLLGFPEFGEIAVAPGKQGDFRVFVKSTSTNRKLAKGSQVLYKKGA